VGTSEETTVSTERQNMRERAEGERDQQKEAGIRSIKREGPLRERILQREVC
jgi:hypothetical protein